MFFFDFGLDWRSLVVPQAGFSWLSEAHAQVGLSPFAQQKCVNKAHFRGAKGHNRITPFGRTKGVTQIVRDSLLV